MADKKINFELSAMKRWFSTIIICFMMLSVIVTAQTTREEFLSNIQRAGGIYHSYEFNQTQATPAPQGYKPFYISHYGRHGSRWLSSAKYYHQPEEVFREAYQANKLTDLGAGVYNRLKIIAADADMRYGELSPLGVVEQKNIAERMFRSFPGVFSSKKGRSCNIYSRSTVVPRCIMSMAAHNERLKELNPKIAIIREASNKNSYLNTEYNTAGNEVIDDGCRDFLKKHFNAQTFLTTLFADTLYIKEHIKDPVVFIYDIFQIAGDLQDLNHIRMDLFDIFSREDIFTLWQTMNIKRYYDFTNQDARESAKGLLKNILNCADSAITHGKISADLRFGHDSYLTALLALMDINELYNQKPEPASIYKVWSDFKVTPMAANLQLVFYRNAKTGDVIVKILHCEQEAKIPVPTDMAPYYHWKDVKNYYWKIIGA
jgi:hypothetical protein